MHTVPFEDKPGNRTLELFMNPTLLFSHRHKDILVHTLRHLQRHVSFAAADEDVAQFVLNLIQVLVPYYLPRLVGDDEIVLEFVVRCQAILVNELYYGVKLLQLVLERSAGEDYRIL